MLFDLTNEVSYVISVIFYTKQKTRKKSVVVVVVVTNHVVMDSVNIAQFIADFLSENDNFEPQKVSTSKQQIMKDENILHLPVNKSVSYAL